MRRANCTRSAASAAANYRSACVARSHTEFRAKLGIALEECDESLYWLEFIRDSELSAGDELRRLLGEGKELARILGGVQANQHPPRPCGCKEASLPQWPITNDQCRK